VEPELYRVVFDSREIDPKQRRRAKRKLARRFRLNRKKIQRLFSGKPAVIKRGIRFERALRLKLAIEQAGGVCVIRNMSPVKQASVPAVAPVLSSIVSEEREPAISESVSWVDLAMAAASLRRPEETSTRQPGDRPKILRQPYDQRYIKDRRTTIRLEEDRRSDTDRRIDNQAWVGTRL